MPDINDLRQRLHLVKQQIFQKLPEIATQNTIEAKALIERNIREVGFGAQYSENKLPIWFFDGKEKSKAGEAFLKRAKKKADKNAKTVDGKKVYQPEDGINWSDLRQAEGLPVDHVDLGFTNKMWAGMGPGQPFFEGNIIRCPLGGNTQEVVDKMEYNRKRYGDYLGKVLGKKEVDILTEIAMNELRIIFNNNGFK